MGRVDKRMKRVLYGLTDDVDDEGVLNAAVLVPHNTGVVAAVEQVGLVQSYTIPRVDPSYLHTPNDPQPCTRVGKAVSYCYSATVSERSTVMSVSVCLFASISPEPHFTSTHTPV